MKKDLHKDPLFANVLYSIQLQQFLQMRSKARILVQKSCVLIGCVDERGVLGEKEVYVDLGERGLVEGKVLVSRCPVTHPGDLRILDGVSRPELAHLRGCIVFSSLGERPMSNRMAGGDLDGDVYWVGWEKSIIEQVEEVESAEYGKPTVVMEGPKTDRLPDHFVFYLQRDVLGRIANLHLALCDKYGTQGPLHPDC